MRGLHEYIQASPIPRSTAPVISLAKLPGFVGFGEADPILDSEGMEGVRYRAVLLDVLGTLLELQPPWPLLRSILKRRHGIDVSEEEARNAILAEMAYYRAHHQEGQDAATLAELRHRCALVVREHLPATAQLSLDELTDVLLDSIRFAPFPDAAPTLAELREAGFRLAAVSNWDCSLRSVLAEVGLAGALDAVVVSARGGCGKA